MFVAAALLCGGKSLAIAEEFKKVISMSPSVTELIYALDAQDQLIGVTRYCIYPPEAQEKTVVGGLLDVNYEVIYSLNPDLVILQDSAGDQQQRFDNMGVKTLQVETRRLEDVISSIDQVGAVLGKKEAADKIANNIKSKIAEVRAKTKDLPKPRVLMTYLRPLGEGAIKEVYIAGNHTYFNDLIEIAGGVNAYQGPAMITSPIVTPEGILRINPDIIIEIMSGALESKYTPESLKKDWEMLPQLDAFKNDKIFIFQQYYISIPGPRIAQALMDIARVVHPEVKWE